MTITGDQNLIKKMNKTIVLDEIKKLELVSRAAISEKTGLNKGTVSSLVNELIESQFVYEAGTGKSSGGRKPVMLLFNHQAGYSIGIDLGVNYILYVITDLSGDIIYEQKESIHDHSTVAILSTLIKTIRELFQKTPKSPYGIIGIGIGVPGIVNEKGTILHAPNLGWKNVKLKQALNDEFKVSVVIDNEANAGTLGENQFGRGQNAENLIYISAGIGIGVGMILRNKIYRGVSGYAGELGHMTIKADGEQCRCGNVGCWELYASEKALLKQSEAISHDENKLQQYIHLAAKGDESVMQNFSQVGVYLGIGISNIINIFNPELIIVGGRLSTAEQWIKDTILSTVEQRALTYHNQKTEVIFSDLRTKSTTLGASTLAISKFFTDHEELI
ncbi:ROK family transcriptional regulator [Chengkuizengella axinellae]|uniref:ROK family transcriptional regulator n=1 Tax=Chengkuizengella axinellae TaxID=3064388 RepID=A0ABT9J3V5_9BACL|nr:ROK family transcriptional regulator [Chengkuizengella sp. 2205SS18-9]MDP5276279.1 ROK family transcriptional regulator [Chengkuizengella sp. 2205SS18-9]